MCKLLPEFARAEKKFTRAELIFYCEFARAEICSLHAQKGKFARVLTLIGRQLLSLPDDIYRRIFFFLDEFGTLQQLSTIINLLTLGRSKGASVWIGIQDIGQIEKIYGRETRQTIINACGNSLIYRVADPVTAKYLSDKIGQVTRRIPQESFSMGVMDTRDGINLSKHEKTEPLVMPSELQELEDLSAYLKFVGQDIAGIELNYVKYHTKNSAFVEGPDFKLVRKKIKNDKYGNNPSEPAPNSEPTIKINIQDNYQGESATSAPLSYTREYDGIKYGV